MATASTPTEALKVAEPLTVEQAREAYDDIVCANYESLQGNAGQDAEDAAFAKIIEAIRAESRASRPADEPIHWRRWGVFGPEGDLRRICLTEGIACETACGDEDVQEVKVFPVDTHVDVVQRPADEQAVAWKDDPKVQRWIAALCRRIEEAAEAAIRQTGSTRPVNVSYKALDEFVYLLCDHAAKSATPPAERTVGEE